ncbi:universal stress protein UspA [Anoxybacterium hadale]|uniref:Universal stress protein UspA n=1 Tax=Anoxybacterium hadale TaxID=3408580 RepID=A0ACD1A7B3_9FIRM|nr:universal stress protein UspA [Clostridiales bacterium]
MFAVSFNRDGDKMKNVMVCVTQQKTCDRLIRYGHDFLGDQKGELFIIHVAHYQIKFLGNSKEGEALEYLYEKALEYGANLTVVRSNDVLETLEDLVTKNKITHVILGESGEAETRSSVVEKLRERVSGKAELIVIPS